MAPDDDAVHPPPSRPPGPPRSTSGRSERRRLPIPRPDTAPAAPAATLEGVLERITFTNDENAWSVVKLALPSRRNLVTAVGNLLGVQPGENLRLTGEWIQDKKYGEQFKVHSYVTVHPATLVGIKKYLGSGLVRGIGPVMAERLVKSFGLDTLEIIESAPARLSEVPGIGPVRAAGIREAWSEQRGVRQVMVFLQSQGISTGYAVKIYKHYRDRAITVVKENPYRLAADIFGIGFKTADRIAANLGVPRTSPRRIEAGVLHVLREMAEDGHVYSPREDLVRRAAEMLEVGADMIETAIVEAGVRKDIVVEPVASDAGSSTRTATASASGAAAHDAIYLAALHAAEAEAAGHLRALIQTPSRPITIDAERALAWFEERRGIRLAPEQREAIRAAFTSKVLIVTGGPGTGKTTLVNGILGILEKKGRRILLAAPTGRAAKRLEETTGRKARTIHRLLEFSPKTGDFGRSRGAPLEADLVIVDESSMLDIVLANSLLRAVPAASQLVLVGDIDQIPSVGPGSVLRDVIASGQAHVVRLTEIFRQAEQSGIVLSAHRVNRGEMPALTPPGVDGDFFFVKRSEPEEVLASLKSLVAERIPRRFGLDPLRDIQVLTPMHRGLLGASNLNMELQALLNPTGASLTRGTRTYRVGDKVMQIRNNYDLDVFNGDIGRIEAIDELQHQVRILFDERTVAYDYADLDEIVLAYACSIHKAQGSEYPCVVVPVHTQHYVMLQRNLLYTALTRGKRLVVLVGTVRALGIAVRNGRVGERHTRLAERIRQG